MAKMQEVTRILLILGMKISYTMNQIRLIFILFLRVLIFFLSDIPGVLLYTGTCFNKKSKYVPSDIAVIIMHASSFFHTSIKVLKN